VLASATSFVVLSVLQRRLGRSGAGPSGSGSGGLALNPGGVAGLFAGEGGKSLTNGLVTLGLFSLLLSLPLRGPVGAVNRAFGAVGGAAAAPVAEAAAGPRQTQDFMRIPSALTPAACVRAVNAGAWDAQRCSGEG
jgi:hypothetical protein